MIKVILISLLYVVVAQDWSVDTNCQHCGPSELIICGMDGNNYYGPCQLDCADDHSRRTVGIPIEQYHFGLCEVVYPNNDDDENVELDRNSNDDGEDADSEDDDNGDEDEDQDDIDDEDNEEDDNDDEDDDIDQEDEEDFDDDEIDDDANDDSEQDDS